MKSRTSLKIVVALVVAALAAAIWFSPARTYLTRENLLHLVGTMRGLWYAPIVFMLAYAIGCVIGVPASLFVLAAGVVWGWKLGAFYALTGGVIGAIAAYYVGKLLGEGLLERFGEAGRFVKRRVAAAGVKTMLIVRLIPGPPFSVWSYGAGVAGVRFRPYFIGTLLGAAPGHFIFAYSADAIFSGALTQGAAVRRLVIVAFLLIFLVLLPTIVSRVFGVRSADEIRASE